ncbi:MAG: hypothetical protein CMN30_30830 [Sandaracinus sp.]|nr:hypothetical protein [Sandaracinus sp.]
MRIFSRRTVLGDGEDDALRIGPATVVCEGSRIASVEEGEPGEFDLDLGDKLLSPAFVDSHTHVALHALRGIGFAETTGNVVEDLFYRFEELLTAEDVAAFARMGAYDRLLSGVGLVWDHYFYGEAIARALADLPMCAVIAPTVQDLAGPGKHRWEEELDATIRLAADEDLADRGVTVALGPHATDTVSAHLWQRVLDEHDALGVPLHAHLAQSVEEDERCRERHNVSCVRWLQDLGVLEVPAVYAHALFVTAAELESFADRHTLVACPHAQLHFGFPARIDLWQRSGARWTVATDAAASNDSCSLREELRYAAGFATAPASFSPAYGAFLHESGPARSVWAARTRARHQLAEHTTPAALLHKVWGFAGSLHPRIRAGVIAPGALANLVAWDLEDPAVWPAHDPFAALVYADAERAIDTMIVAGQVVGTPGDLRRSVTTSDTFREHREEAAGRLAALLKRLGR